MVEKKVLAMEFSAENYFCSRIFDNDRRHFNKGDFAKIKVDMKTTEKDVRQDIKCTAMICIKFLKLF